MRFESDAVDLDAAVLKIFDQAAQGSDFVVGRLNSIVIVVQFDVCIDGLDGFLGKLESKVEVIWPDGVVPNAWWEGSIAEKCLVDDVPRVTTLPIMCNNSFNVILNDCSQASFGPWSFCDEWCDLGRPDQVVTSDFRPRALCKI